MPSDKHCHKPKASLKQSEKQIPIREKTITVTIPVPEQQPVLAPGALDLFAVDIGLEDKIVPKVNFAILGNINVYNDQTLINAQVEVKAHLNGSLNGVGVAGISDKIETAEQLKLARNVDKLGCFCIATPWNVAIEVRNLDEQAALNITAITVDIRLGIRAKVKEIEQIRYDSESSSIAYTDCDRRDKCNRWKDEPRKCENPCCPDNPCGFLKPEHCSDKFNLVNGFWRRERGCVENFNVGASIQPATTFKLRVQLCDKCKGKLLTNAWCVFARVLSVDSGELQTIELSCDGLRDSIIGWDGTNGASPLAFPYRELSVGQGVQDILRQIDTASTDCDDKALERAKWYNDFLFAVDGFLDCELKITPFNLVNRADVVFDWGIVYVTKVKTGDKHDSELSSDSSSTSH